MNQTNNLPAEKVTAIFRSLRQLKARYEGTMNKDELAELLIGATILEGFDSGKRIIGTLAMLGMNRKHAGIILDRLKGSGWRRCEDGRYELIT